MDSRAYWSPDQIERMVPPLAENGRGAGRERPKGETRTEPHAGAGEPPVRLSKRDRPVWAGEEYCERDGGGVDRSATLFWIACAVARGLRGVPLADSMKVGIIAEAVKDRDRALGFEKFKDRPALYTETAERAFAEVAAEVAFQISTTPPGEEESVASEAHDGGDKLPPELELTDLGNALRFAKRFAGRLIYSPGTGGYAEYRAGRYVRDDLGQRFELAKAIPQEFMFEAVTLAGAGDQDRAKKLSKHGIASAARPRIESMVALAHSDPRIAVPSENLDGDPYLFNCASGTIDLRTGQLRGHDQGDRLTKISPIEYWPDAECPTWFTFLEEILPDEELRVFLKRWFGWCLTGIVDREILPIFYGTGANGKSTLMNILLELLGDYGQQAPQDLLMAKRREHPTELADLFGRRLVASAESEENGRLNESLVKQLTGHERIRARYMRQDFFEFWPTHKLVLLTNHKPAIRGTDMGVWRRLKVVPFEVAIPEEKQDRRLADRLREELPGILHWAVEGCLEWQRDGLPEPERIRAATSDYREEQDALGSFLEECCIIVEDENRFTFFADLFEVYQEWCKRSGEHALKKRAFGDRLKERSFPPDNGPKNKAIRRRIILRDDAPRPDRAGSQKLFNASGSTDNINPEGEKVNQVNLENSRKLQEKGERVNEGYPNSDISGQWNHSRGGDTETTLTQVNSLTHDSPSAGHRLSEEQAREVQRLINDGVAPKVARAEVLGSVFYD